METLINDLKVALATSFSFYLKSHNFHWNVEGPNFPEYHSFLDSLYNEVWTAIDGIAEHIRTLDAYVPGSYSRFQELSKVSDESNIPGARQMFSRLVSDNKIVIDTLTQAMKSAEAADKPGIANFLQDRIDIHEKHGWMLRSITKE